MELSRFDNPNPPQLFALVVTTTSDFAPPAHRAFLYLDELAAHRAGEKMVADRPAESTGSSYVVLPLEGPR